MASAFIHVELDLRPLQAVQSEAKRNSITLKGIKAAAKIAQQAAKVRAPRRAYKGGGLKQSMGVKTGKGRKSKSLSYAVVGARLKVVRLVPPRKGAAPRRYVPGKIVHIVEKRKPFIGPAWAAVKAEAIKAGQAVILAEVEKVLAKQALKVK